MAANTFGSYAALTDETFKKLNLSREVIRGSTFSECQFIRCDFSETQFLNCRFLECAFEDCSMKLTEVEDTTFSNVQFSQCNLMGVNWTKANWSEWATQMNAVEFDQCILEYGVFLGLTLKKLKLTQCNAREVNFSEANLSEADFKGTDFAGAIFLKTNLTKANFAGAKNYALNPLDNPIKGATFSLPEALNLLYAMRITLVDPETNQEIISDDSPFA